ncbi:MAG: hypothetical protein ACLPWF_00110 [Bryobacteraceae bacterium]
MQDSIQDFIAELSNPRAIALRESTCSALAEALAATGAVLWAFGLADHPRRAIASAIQMGGEMARGAVLLLRDDNRYAAAALVRQVVEIEYLLCLFTLDKDEPLRWASSDLEAVRKEYQPSRMRERCGGRFRSTEYSSHCQVGGHPRFAAGYVLPEHIRTGPLTDAVIFAAGWVDLAQHLVQVWRWVEEILHIYNLLDVGLAQSSLSSAKASVDLWLREDKCAPLLTEAEVLLLKQTSQANSAT